MNWIITGLMMVSNAQSMTFCTEDWNPVCCLMPKTKSPVVAPNACKCGAKKGKVVKTPAGKDLTQLKPWKSC